jgi:hypothetical protein
MILHVCTDIDQTHCNCSFRLYWYILLKMVAPTETFQGWKIKKEKENFYQSHWTELIITFIKLLVWRTRMNQIIYIPACNIYAQYLALTPMNRIILTKIQVGRTVTKFPVFYITPRLIIKPTRTCRGTVSDSDNSSVLLISPWTYKDFPNISILSKQCHMPRPIHLQWFDSSRQGVIFRIMPEFLRLPIYVEGN